MAQITHQIKAEIRTAKGRSRVKHLKEAGLIPATLYGKGIASISIQFPAKELIKTFKEAGELVLVELLLDNQKIPVLFKNPQYHYLNGHLIHLDCFRVNLKEKITAEVPIVLVGESPAVKEGNILVTVSDQINVEALPADLPEKIEVDIGSLTTIGAIITAGDLILDKSKVELKTAADQVIVKIEEPKIEEEPVAPVTPPEEVPATEQKEKTQEEASEKSEEK